MVDGRARSCRRPPKLAPAQPAASTPLYPLGAPIGEGASSVVVEGRRARARRRRRRRRRRRLRRAAAAAAGARRGQGTPVAVKVVPTGSEAVSELSTCARSTRSSSSHDHIVKVMDVLEVSTRRTSRCEMDGPSSPTSSRSPSRRVPHGRARVFFATCSRCCATRTGAACCTATSSRRTCAQRARHGCRLGLARRVGATDEPVMCGTPQYARPSSSPATTATPSAAGAAHRGGRRLVGVTLYCMVAGEVPFGGHCATSSCATCWRATARRAAPLRCAPPRRDAAARAAERASLQEGESVVAEAGLLARRRLAARRRPAARADDARPLRVRRVRRGHAARHGRPRRLRRLRARPLAPGAAAADGAFTPRLRRRVLAHRVRAGGGDAT